MIRILALETDATVFLFHRTALRKTPPVTPQFVTFHVTVFWVEVMSIPTQADGDQHYGQCQAGLILLLKNFFPAPVEGSPCVQMAKIRQVLSSAFTWRFY